MNPFAKACSVAVLLGIVLAATDANAQDYPSRTIRIISPHPAGIATDVLGRSLAQKLNERFGQPVIVENRTGANGIVAAAAVAKAEPDGYTLHITTGTHIANAHVGAKLSYDVLADFAPVTQLAASYGLALLTNQPVSSVADLVALGKKRRLSYAMNGVGNITHIAGLLLERRAGLEMTAVPYNTPVLTTDVMTGTVDFTFISIATAIPLVNSGKLKAIALTGTRRAPSLAQVPTMQELGYKDFDITGYFGLLFPAKTPRERIDLIYRASKTALETAELRRVIDAGGFYAVGSTPDEFARHLKDDYAFQGKLMKEVGLAP
ncbi:MAG: tripartite tricarboxylate transporter substrate binding protein [Hyphomicrobiales bacterium]|nr:tripartite tricarboxylate transporter substrate binding protein [Hyphomicrobiales bacterium]